MSADDHERPDRGTEARHVANAPAATVAMDRVAKVGIHPSSMRAYRALCSRDLWVTFRHEPVAFLAQALLQPIFFLFVFGRVLPDLGSAQGSYGTQLLPGVLALTLGLTTLQNVALPLVIEFSFTKEIEDRLLAPLPVYAVGLSKITVAALRGIIAAVLILPLGALILPGGINLHHTHWWAFVLVAIFGSVTAGFMGLVLGTLVPANRINVVFAIVLTPLIFTGCTFYPWRGLVRLRWFQVVTCCNPLTYVAEGTRASIGGVAHMGAGWIVLGLAVSLLLFGTLGLRGFIRRAVD